MTAGRLAVSVTTALLTIGAVAMPAAAGDAPVRSLPKGRPPVSEQPTPRAERDPHGTAATFMYVSGRQFATATGASVTLRQSRPQLDPTDYHSLAELAVQSADQQQIVEVGWTVDRALNGDTVPHLFVYHWVDRMPTCYNGCGFVQVSQTIHPGDPVAVGARVAYKINFAKNKWWIFYDNQKVGYFPASLWQGRYTQAGLVQAFGEVAVASPSPCTDMGNGIFGTVKRSATISRFALVGSAIPSSLFVFSTQPALYNSGAVKATSFRYGGPGGC